MAIHVNIRGFLLRLHPADRAVVALLALAVLVAGVRLPAVGEPLVGLFAIHMVLLVLFIAVAAAMACWQQGAWVLWVRPAVTVAVIFTLYTTAGKLGVAAMPYDADAALSRYDNALFGLDPSLFIQRYQSPACVEFFSFIYSSFIPYIYLSLALGCLGRPALERDQFLTGWVFLYAISYLGYLFVPAHGPVVYHALDYSVHLEERGGYFYGLVVRGITASGGLQGVFPSLHVGGSVYLCLFDLHTNRLRGLTYLPMVIGIYIATIVLRYHYVVDLLAGTLIAVGCIPLGRRVFAHWAHARQVAGLPALPGGEGDVLPALSGAGPPDAASLLSAY